jgi:hypothetical protein
MPGVLELARSAPRGFGRRDRRVARRMATLQRVAIPLRIDGYSGVALRRAAIAA